MYQESHVSRAFTHNFKFAYNNKKAGLRSFLLIIFILIILRLLHQYLKIQTYTKNNEIIFHELILPGGENCFITSKNWQINLTPCEDYQKGSLMRVIGRIDPISDSAFGLKKRLIIEEVVLKNNSQISVQRWLVLAGIYLRSLATGVLEETKSNLEASTHGFLAGLIFGNDDYLPAQKRHLFEVIGMQHVLVTSGFHLSYLVSLWYSLLKHIGNKRVSGFVCLLSILVYTLMVGIRPSILRACIMTSFSLVAATFFSRKMPITWSFLLTIAIMILINPWYIDSVSFQLSLAATAAIVLITSRKKSRLGQGSSSSLAEKLIGFEVGTTKHSGNDLSRLWGNLLESIKISTAIQVAILPIISWHFGEINLLGFLANPLLLWLVPSVFSSGITYLFVNAFSSLLPVVSNIFALYAWTVAEIFFTLASLLEERLGNHALISFTFSSWQVVAWYILLLGFWLVLARLSQVKRVFNLIK